MDKENLKIIMNISYSLLDNFIKLRNLEANGGKDSEEFISIINCIKASLSLEDSLYSKIDIKQIDSYLNELNHLDNVYEIDSEINVSKTMIFDDLVKRRVTDRLLDIKYRNNKSDFDYGNICYEIKKDIILNIYLNDYKFQTIFKELLNFKYNLGFLYKEIESDFLENNFSINPELYLTSYLIGDLYEMPREIVDNFKYSFGVNILEKEIDFILSQSSYNLRDKDNYAKSIISQILIRASLLFTDENVSQEMKEHIGKFININSSLNGDNTLEKLILEALNFYESDRELPKVIGLIKGI